MLKRMAFARQMQKNAELFQGVGAYYRKHANPKAAFLAQKVITQGAKVRLYAIRALVLLRFWMLLRAYAWPVLGRGSATDRKFWLLRFLPAYQVLEDKGLELTRLAEPHEYDALLKKTSRGPSKREQRVRQSNPGTAIEDG
ncbi:MAG TPA: hypothetical protein VFR24_26640 [Candidatus Angelobacter sp.]|nr:hypothetical protein [Candidatus Angelobacter sp.]